LQNYARKVKYLEKLLQHVLVAAPKQSEACTTTKRGYVDFSSSQEQGLQKPLKHPRVVTEYHLFIYYILYVNKFKYVIYIIISTVC